MAVPLSNEQQNAVIALMRERVPAVAELGRLFARHGHELALVGGWVRDILRGQQSPGDLDMTTDATPDQVLKITGDWADRIWEVGIAQDGSSSVPAAMKTRFGADKGSCHTRTPHFVQRRMSILRPESARLV